MDEHSTEDGTSMLKGLQEKQDYKTQYLETLRSVQDLIDQYEEMSDEDKVVLYLLPVSSISSIDW